jgi:hypothetical protein
VYGLLPGERCVQKAVSIEALRARERSRRRRLTFSAQGCRPVVAPPPPPPPPPGGVRKCAASYPTVCIPPPPPDLDCGDIPYTNFRVRWDVADPDPHHFDGDHDGVGCES